MDYGAALEMRFGATRRGFESRPLRHYAPARLTPIACVAVCSAPLTHVRVRSLAVLAGALRSTPIRTR